MAKRLSSSSFVSQERSKVAGTQTSRFVFPNKVDGISDHVKSHDEGQFLGAALADIEVIGLEEMHQSMKNLAASSTESSTTRLPDASIKLIGQVTKYSFAKEIERLSVGREHDQMNIFRKIMDPKYEYLCLRKITGYFVPLSSSTMDKYEVVVVLRNRSNKEDQQEICKVIFDSTIACSFFMSMDFFVNFKDLNSLILEIHCNQDVVRQGVQWAALRLGLTCRQSSFPKSLNIFPTQVQIYPPYSLLFPVDRDPRLFNARLTQGDLGPLSQMYLDNEIGYTEETLDQVEKRTKSRYAGTKFAHTKDDSKISTNSGGSVDDTTKKYLKKNEEVGDRLREEGLIRQRSLQLSSKEPPSTILKKDRVPVKMVFDPDTNFAEAFKRRLPDTRKNRAFFKQNKVDPAYNILITTIEGDLGFVGWKNSDGTLISVKTITDSLAATVEAVKSEETSTAFIETKPENIPSSSAFQTDAIDEKGMPRIDEQGSASSSVGSLFDDVKPSQVAFKNNEEDRNI